MAALVVVSIQTSHRLGSCSWDDKLAASAALCFVDKHHPMSRAEAKRRQHNNTKRKRKTLNGDFSHKIYVSISKLNRGARLIIPSCARLCSTLKPERYRPDQSPQSVSPYPQSQSLNDTKPSQSSRHPPENQSDNTSCIASLPIPNSVLQLTVRNRSKGCNNKIFSK